MSSEQLKNIVEQYHEYLDKRDLDGLLSLYAPTLKFHGLAPQPLGPEGVKQAMMAFYDAFPDSRMPYDDIIAEGNRVAVRHRFEGTHLGDFSGIPPTGQKVAITATEILRFEGNKVVEGWLNADIFGLMQQLGVVPTPEH
jgi:predicted ester cyclase